MEHAPIFIAACRRPFHLRKLLESLQANPESKNSNIYIVVGGPKNFVDWPMVYETIKIATSTQGFLNVYVYERPELLTGSSLIHFCVEEAFKSHERVIILEDDLSVRADFLHYMNLALEFYRENEKVVQISGWNFGTISSGNPQATYLFPISIPWGWATWKRAWVDKPPTKENFEWLTQKNSRIKRFNFEGNYNCIGMIEAILEKNYDAWDAACYLDNFRNGKLIVYPNSSLVLNNGFDGSGLNFQNNFSWSDGSLEPPQPNFTFKSNMQISKEYKTFLRFHAKWVCKSFGWKRSTLVLDKILRLVRQHLKYCKKGYYLGT